MIKSPPSPSDYADERARPEEYLLRLQDQRRRAYIQDPFGSTFDRSGSLPQEGLIQQRGRSTLYQNDLTYPSKFLRPGTQYLASPNDLYFKGPQDDPSSHPRTLEREDGVMTRARALSLQSAVDQPEPSTSKTRVLGPPRLRRRATSKVSKNMVAPPITAPLSELTKHMTHIAIKNIEEYVQRPIEVRRLQSKKSGKIPRPMNSFMLYRSAYAERIKQWCAQNNHQVVSRVSGQSWPLEPPKVREYYERCAVLERDNHQRAHPEYKFAPNKAPAPPKKKRTSGGKTSHYNDDVGNGDDDASLSEFHSQSTSPTRKRSKSCGVDSNYESRASTPFDNSDLMLPEAGNRVGWPYAWPNSQMSHSLPSQQHSFLVQQHMSGLGSGYYNSSGHLVGLPSSVYHPEGLQPYSLGANFDHGNNNQLDPQLLAVDNSVMDASVSRSFNQDPYHLWQHESSGPNFMQAPNAAQLELDVPGYSNLSSLEEGQTEWSFNPPGGSVEAGKEFEHWLDLHTGKI